MRAEAFSAGQIGAAAALATLIQSALVVLLIISGAAAGFTPKPEPPPRVMSIAVKPMIDLPLLKKGGKPRANKLPDMWKPPQQIKRREAPKTVAPVASKEAPPTPKKEEEKEKKPPKPDEKPPDPETPVAKEVDETVKEVEKEVVEPNLPEEGAVDGVEEGTEKDPLKARAVDLYRVKLTGWFRQGFNPPMEIDCAVLKELRASVQAKVSPDGTVLSYDMQSSGNDVFDARVKQVMDGKVGQKVPPPPPNYPDILDSVVLPTFQGKNEQCK